MQYQLKIQQLVTYAKSRVYRNFIRALSDNENIRLNGESNLFYFGTDIEERAKSIERSNKMLKFVDHAVQIMREKNKNGEVFYQVLYFNYLSPYESASNEDVTQALVDAGYPMCRKTMTEYRSLAVDCVSSILWGFSSRDCREILDRFVEE